MSTPVQLFPILYCQDSSLWFEQVRQLAMPIWLDSGHPQSSYGRFDIISAAPAITFTCVGKVTQIAQDNSIQESTENPFTLLQHYLPGNQPHLEHIPFCGGILGYFGYDLGRRLESLPVVALQDISLADMHLGLYPWAIVQDHHTQKAWLVINSALAPTYNFLDIEHICSSDLHVARFHDLKSNIKNSEKLFNINEFQAELKVGEYRSAVKKIQAYIAAGDCYQVNFAQRFSAEFTGDPFVAYLELRQTLPSPFSAYMEVTGGAILSLSPERFIKLQHNQAETKPIKGTVARGKTPEEDSANAARLLSSVKDRAENLMIVDLLRNDLSKTCVEVNVPELFGLQSFANVHHLVSTVTASLKPGMNAVDLLASCFPGGSITGAPKIRAMEIIEELEPVRRSLYCGSLGYISACGNMDTSIAIRTLVCDRNKMYCWGGGGIVADSETETEYQESLAKVKVLMDTLEYRFGRVTST